MIAPRLVDIFILVADVFMNDSSMALSTAYNSLSVSPGQLPLHLHSYLCPSQTPKFREALETSISLLTTETRKQLISILTTLDTPLLSIILTGSTTLVRNMTMDRKSKVVAGWRDSHLAVYRHLFRSFYLLSVPLFVGLAPDSHNRLIGYPGRDNRPVERLASPGSIYNYSLLPKPAVPGTELNMSRFDTLIVGSGSGAGVVAHTLSENGISALVVEKGQYFPQLQYHFDDLEGSQKLYEGHGSIALLDGSISVLAGSTFGGGSTVNWLACLRTPPQVRQEWTRQHGVEWVDSLDYDECMDYVWDKMGVTTSNLNHSFLNRIILNGSRKLNYTAGEVGQNDGGFPSHPCKLCHVGCKSGVKQGSAACWFKSAAQRGTEFMVHAQVLRILHRNGIAYGVLCQDQNSGVHFTMTGFKKIIVSAGSLNTPLVLQNSGFKNRHIGSNLKLHPVSVLFGEFGESVNDPAVDHPILTSVCTESANTDGKGHGARIEAMLHSPYFALAFLPWLLSDDLKSDLSRYLHMSCLLLITRDTSSGKIRRDSSPVKKAIIDYTVNEFDRKALHKAMLIASDLLYVEGVRQIIPPQPWMRRFNSTIPKHERKIKDKDYVAWRNEMKKIPFDLYGTSYGSAHQMSSCRITGNGPLHGACDSRGRLFESNNVYVADASILPTASGVNPMITIMAFARKIALGIARDMLPSPNL